MAEGYNLDFVARVNTRALDHAAKRFDRNQKEVIGELARFAARSSRVEFNLRLAGSLDAMNNFRKKYTRYARRVTKVAGMEAVIRLEGPRTPILTGRTRASSNYQTNFNKSQSFEIQVSQGAAKRPGNGYRYIGPLHDTGSNVSGTKFWFLKATDAFQNNMEKKISPNPATLARLIR